MLKRILQISKGLLTSLKRVNMAIRHNRDGDINREGSVDYERIIKDLRKTIKDMQNQLHAVLKKTEHILNKTAKHGE